MPPCSAVWDGRLQGCGSSCVPRQHRMWPGWGCPCGRASCTNAPPALLSQHGVHGGCGTRPGAQRCLELADAMLAALRSWQGLQRAGPAGPCGSTAWHRLVPAPSSPLGGSSPSTHWVSLGERAALRCLLQCPACPLLPCLHPAPLCPAATPCTWSSGVPAVPTWATGRVFGLWGVLGFCICVPCVARRHPAPGADTAEPFAPRGDGGSKGTAAVPRSSCSTKEPEPRTNWLWHGGRGAQRVDGHRTECCRTVLAPTQLTRAACRAGGGGCPPPHAAPHGS